MTHLFAPQYAERCASVVGAFGVAHHDTGCPTHFRAIQAIQIAREKMGRVAGQW